MFDKIFFFPSLFLGIALVTETVGVWQRVLGSSINSPAQGYSSHVRLATLGRFFILTSAPALGYLVDSGSSPQFLLSIAILTHVVVILGVFIFMDAPRSPNFYAYKILNKNLVKFDVNKRAISMKNMKGYFSFSFTAFLITSNGILAVNTLAGFYPEYRAFVIQAGGLFTVFGTLLHVFKVDPLLSKTADIDVDLLVEYVRVNLLARMIASLTSLLFYFCLKLLLYI